MVRNLQDLQSEQSVLREQLIEVYKAKYRSILKLAQAMNMPYTTLRAFLMGSTIRSYNIFRIKSWLEQ